MATAKTVEMNLAKTTKGTYVYEAVVKKGAAVTVVYVRKEAFPDGPPDSITLTVAG